MSGKIADVVRAKQSFESFALNDDFIDQSYYDQNGGVVLKDYHRDWVEKLEKHDKIALTAFTGSGKTTVPGVLYPLWKIFNNPGYEVLVVSATMSQSKKILNEIKHHISECEYLNDLKPDDRSATWNQTEIELTNDSKIYCKPFTEAVKGVHVDLVICDEAAEFDDHEMYSRYVVTRAESKDGTVCLISTPVHENDLMSKMSDGTMTPKCPSCGVSLDKAGDGEWVCSVHGGFSKEESRFDENVSSRNYWSKTYPVYREVEEGADGGFRLSDDKWVRPVFPENFDERRIRELRDEDMTMFQKEYLCLGEGTKIQLEEGMKNIEDIEVGDKVLTHTGNFKQVTETMEREAEEKVKVKTKGWSEKIEMTPEHPVLTEDGWKEAGDLQPLDYLVTPRMSGDKSIDESLGKIYGYYLAEGSIGASDRQVTFNFGAHEEEFIEDCKQSLRSQGYEPKLYGHGADCVCRVTVNSVDLVEELTEKFGRAEGKKVPSEVFELGESSIESIFEAYVNGDGYRPNGGKGKISSVSLELAEGAARMATSLGYTVTRDYFKQQGEGGLIDGREIEGNGEYHRVRYYKQTQYNKIEDDYAAYRVKSVEFERDESKVYNIEVEDDHTYHTAQFAVHNCEPLAVEGDLFDPNDIIELYDKSEDFENGVNPRSDYYMGADFAVSHQGDYSVFTVVEDPRGGVPVVRNMERIRGMGLDAQEKRIKELHQIYRFKRIVLDETNFGTTVKKSLKEQGLPIRGQGFKLKQRNNLIVGLKNAVEKGELVLPRGGEQARKLTDKLYEELLGFGTSETQGGSITYKSTAKHDDTVMSLAMVLTGIDDDKPVVATLAY